MPFYSNVLSNKLRSGNGFDVARVLHFTLTARDNAPRGTAQTNTDEMVVNVIGTTGPFVITSQNTDNLLVSGAK
jgi:hypothetical protein